MRVILIEGEPSSLTGLEAMLSTVPDMELVGRYDHPIVGKEKALSEDADIVFMDIQLPDIDGIELAAQILKRKPHIGIVFLAACDRYAVKAFELNALDYLLKPVRFERLQKTLQRIRNRTGSQAARPLRIRLFQQFSMSAESGDVQIRWRTSRAQELFLHLLQHRGKIVRKSTLAELLWPEYPEERAYSQLYTTIYHVRKALQPYARHLKIVNTPDGYVLNLQDVWIDVEEFERFIQSELPLSSETIGLYEAHMSLYTGDYLKEHEYWWAEGERYRLQSLWIRTSFRMAEWYLDNRQRDKAAEKYLDVCHRNPLAEEAHYALMQIYAANGKVLSVHRQYNLLKTVLLDELNEQPSPYITEWYEHWRKKTMNARRCQKRAHRV